MHQSVKEGTPSRLLALVFGAVLFGMDGVDVGRGELVEDELVKVSDTDVRLPWFIGGLIDDYGPFSYGREAGGSVCIYVEQKKKNSSKISCKRSRIPRRLCFTDCGSIAACNDVFDLLLEVLK
jgi:hypothetical protein